MKKLFILLFALVTLNTFSFEASAQCAMCRSVAESNLKNDPAGPGKGLNTGILYLMSFPYILAAIGGYIWYMHKKKAVQQ
jgi:hypothetical protein